METLTEPRPQVVERELHSQSEIVPKEQLLAENDYLQTALNQAGIDGDAVAEIIAGDQHFAVVNISRSYLTPDGKYYKPFLNETAVKTGTPTKFELDKDIPFLLVHFDQAGSLVGRALRPNSPVMIGRDAGELDSKSKRFSYEHDSHLSRDHFMVEVHADHGVRVTDRNSTNGTQIRYGGRIARSDMASHAQQENDITVENKELERRKIENSRLSSEVLLIPEMFPNHELKIEGKTFYMSDILSTKESREYAVLYSAIQDESKTVVAPRLLYKSNSDGGWRVAYGVEKGGRLIKEAQSGHFAHYTQETKLHTIILDQLEKAEKNYDTSGAARQKLLDIFSKMNQNRDQVNTAPSEVKYHQDLSLDHTMDDTVRLLSAGETDKPDLNMLRNRGFNSFSEYIESLDKVFDAMPGFVPDFSTLPEKSVTREHTLLGETQIEEFPAFYGDTPIIWSMARDRQGRTWVENIRLRNAKATSYGTYSPVFDGGFITNKPLEYASTANGLRYEKEYREFNGGYVDITPLTSKLKPIKEYKKRFSS